MTTAQPVDILPCLENLGRSLAALGRSERGATLASLEQAVLARVRDALPDLLGAVLRLSTPGLDGRHAPLREACPTCGVRVRVQSWRPRRIRTICGEVTMERPWYVCRGCHHGWGPADAVLGLVGQGRLSAGVDAWVVRLGAATDFREAAVLLEELTGLALAPQTVRQHTEQAGTTLVAREEADARHVERTRAPAGPVDPAPGVLLVEVDGVHLRYLDGWHEVKIGLAAGCIDGATVSPTYVAVRADATTFGPRLLATAAHRGALDVQAWQGGLWNTALAILRPVVVLGDGAPWIWALAAEHFGDRTEIVDFFHAAEHLSALAHALHGRDAPAAATTWRHILLDEGPDALLTLWHGIHAPTDAIDILRQTRGYFRTNADRMRYAQFRAAGLPIGSGSIESAAKHLVQLRLKRPGARWSHDGAAALLALRARDASSLPLAA